MKSIILLLLILFTNNVAFTQKINPISNVLRLKWVDSVENWTTNFNYPTLTGKYIIPFSARQYVFNIIDGKKVNVQLLLNNKINIQSFLFEDINKIELLELDNLKIFEFEKESRATYNGYKSVSYVLDSNIYFKLNNTDLIKYNFLLNKLVWRYSVTDRIKSQPIINEFNKTVIFCSTKNIHVLDKGSGKEIWRLQVGEKIKAKVELVGQFAYVWSKGKGLVAIDLDKRQIAWNFYTINQAQEKNQYNLLIEGDTIFFVSGDVYAVNRLTGELIWKTNHNCASHASSMDVGITKKYVLYYDHCAESFPLLTAVNKQTGKVEYQEFTSELYPPDDETGLSDLDIRNFSFVRGMYKNYKIAIYMDKIYCFEVLE